MALACIHKQDDKLSEGKRGRVWAPPVTAEIGDELEAWRGTRRARASGGLAVERTNVLEPLFFFFTPLVTGASHALVHQLEST